MKSYFLASLESLEKKAQNGPITIREVFEHLGGKGDEIIILFLCLPFVQPLPLLGLSTPLGLLICGAAIFNYLNRPPWLPKIFMNKTMQPQLLLSILRVAEKIWSYVEKILKPRWLFMFRSHFFRVFNTLLIVSQALLLCLPLPVPFSNTVPTLVIIANTMGQLEEDGLLILISYFLLMFSISFFSGLAFGVDTGIDFFRNYLQ